MNATNRCCKCQHEWHDHPAGYAQHNECPKCGSLYWLWLDYAQPGNPGELAPAEPRHLRSGRPKVNLAS